MYFSNLVKVGQSSSHCRRVFKHNLLVNILLAIARLAVGARVCHTDKKHTCLDRNINLILIPRYRDPAVIWLVAKSNDTDQELIECDTFESDRDWNRVEEGAFRTFTDMINW